MNFTTLDLTREHSSRRSAELGFGTVESILTLTFSSSSPRGTSYSWSQREDFLLLSSDGGHFLRLETSVFQLNGSPQLSSPASSKSSKIKNFKNQERAATCPAASPAQLIPRSSRHSSLPPWQTLSDCSGDCCARYLQKSAPGR